MKHKYLTLIALLLSVISCRHGDTKGHDEQAAEEVAHSHEPHEGLIELSEHEAGRFGVKCSVASPCDVAETATLPGTIISSETTATSLTAARQGKMTWNVRLHEGMPVRAGQILASVSPTAISGGDSDAAARVRLEALEAEIRRVTPLVEDGIVSRKDYNALLSEAEQQRRLTQTAAGSTAIVSPVTGIITQVTAGNGTFVNPGDIIASVQPTGKQSGAMLRVDIPQRLFQRMADIRTAIVTASDGENIILPRSTSATSAGSSGFIPVYFGPVTDDRLVAGSNVEARVALGGRQTAMSLPLSAISEQEGVYSVFVKIKDGHYSRTPVTVGMTDNTCAEIISGISATDSVVTRGAVFLRLAETRANAPQGHTHNH